MRKLKGKGVGRSFRERGEEEKSMLFLLGAKGFFLSVLAIN